MKHTAVITKKFKAFPIKVIFEEFYEVVIASNARRGYYKTPITKEVAVSIAS